MRWIGDISDSKARGALDRPIQVATPTFLLIRSTGNHTVPYIGRHLALLGPVLFLGAWWQWHKEEHQFHTLDAENRPIVERINALDLLLGRTVLVAATKIRPSFTNF